MRLPLVLLSLSALLLVPALPAQPPAAAQGAGILEAVCSLPPPLGRATGPAHLTLLREGSVPDEWIVEWEFVSGPIPCGTGAGPCLAHGTLAAGLDIDGCEGSFGALSPVEGCVVGPGGAYAQGTTRFHFGHEMPDSPAVGGTFDLVLVGDAIADAGCA